MKKTKKVLASLAIAGMVATTVPFNALADTSATRIFGSDRIQTAIQVAQAGWSTGAATVIVAPAADANLVDALAAAPLAGQDNAPILLTAGSALDPNTKQEILDLKATKVIAVGALSDQVINDLKAISGLTVQQLKGTDRIDTANKIAGQLTAPAGTFVVGYGALPDALSVASYAAANDYEILVANPDGSLPSSEVPVGTKYVIGGPTLVNDGAVPGATRIFGLDRYDTNNQVIQKLGSDFGTVFVANGENAHLVDSLVASGYAAKTKSMIALTDNSTVKALDYLGQKMTDSSKAIALGGTGVVSEAIRSSVKPGGGVTPITNPAGITSVNMSSGMSVAMGQALVNVGTVTVNGGASGATVTGINLTRTGLSADKTIKGITVWNGATRLNVSTIFSNGVADINFSNPLTLTANQSATLAIKLNVAAKPTAVSGAQFAITLNSLKGADSSMLPATSGTMTVTDVNLGTLDVSLSGDAPTANSTLDAGTTDQRLTKFDFQALTEDQLLKQVTFTQEGSAGDTDLTNLKLYNNGTQVGATATMSNRKVTFTFGDGILITSGSTLRLEMRGDIVGGSGRDINFDVNDVNDVQAVGKTYGSTIVATLTGTSSTDLKIDKGSFIISKASNSPVASTIAQQVKGQNFSTISLQAVGEPIQLQTIKLMVTTGGGAKLSDLTNLKLTTTDGTVIAQDANPDFTTTSGGGIDDVTLNTPITITPGTPVAFTISADIPTTVKQGCTYQLGVSGTTDALTGQGNVSGSTVSYPSSGTTGDVMGNVMTVGDVHVTVTPEAKADTNLYLSSTGNNLITFDLTQNMSEDVSLSQLTLQYTGNTGDFANMEIVDSTGKVISNVISTPSSTPSFNFNNPVVIPANKTVSITLKADVLSTADTTQTHKFSVPQTSTVYSVAHTVALGTTVNVAAATDPTIFSISQGGASVTKVTVSRSTNANLDPAYNAQRGSKDVVIDAIKLNNTTTGEDAIVKSIYLNPVYGGNLAAQDVSNIRLVDYKDNTKVYLTIPQLPAGGQKYDLTTPITIGSTDSSHSADIEVLADINSTAPYSGTFGVDVGDGTGAGSAIDLSYQTATTGQTIDSSTDASSQYTGYTTTHITESKINVAAATIANPVTDKNGNGQIGNTIGQFALTNNGSKSVAIDQVQLTDTMQVMETLTNSAYVQLVKTDDGTVLTSAPAKWDSSTMTFKLGTNLRIDPGATKNISVRVTTVGDLAAGKAVALRLLKAGTLYEDVSTPSINGMGVDDNATSAVITFVTP